MSLGSDSKQWRAIASNADATRGVLAWLGLLEGRAPGRLDSISAQATQVFAAAAKADASCCDATLSLGKSCF